MEFAVDYFGLLPYMCCETFEKRPLLPNLGVRLKF